MYSAFPSKNPYEVFSFQEFWSLQSATFLSFYFILFVFALAAFYYAAPRKFRWIVLLAGSAAFYAVAGLLPFLTVTLSAALTWAAALSIEDIGKEERRLQKILLASAVVVLLAVLTFGKLWRLFGWNIPYIVPLGISYYTFSAIAYLADVYWGRDMAERNFFKLALFLLWFPKILQGPISRRKTLGPQLTRGNRFDYEGFCFGMQLSVWGYMKKMVLADRIALFTGTIFASPDSYGGAMLFLAAVLSTAQLYCDFSGCMDIAGGVSEMFGIRLEKNFNRPFFSRSASEFWRRWHITLGTWFKDYVYMPLATSPSFIRLFGKVSGRFGKRVGKTFMVALPLAAVWLLTGLWHGTGVNYVVWGLYWGLLIIVSTALAPEFRKLKRLLRIDEKSDWWRRVQMIRTFLLFCASRILVIPENLAVSGGIFRTILTDSRPWEMTDGTLFRQGLSSLEFFITLLMIALLWHVETQQEKGVEIRKRIAGWPLVIRCAFYALSLLFILIFGIYGPSYGITSFVYMQF